MDIRLVDGCVNCGNLEGTMCSVHQTLVNIQQTCDSFDMQPTKFKEVDCMSCIKRNSPDCPHQANASQGMMCSSYSPEAMA